MNPLTNMRNVLKLSEQELKNPSGKSWHDMYRDSAWIFIAGFPYTLSEGDIICVFSQYGEVVNINLVRDSKTGKSKGFCFLCYEDQRSTVLAVDNLNGIKIIDRTLRVDHVADYKPPKDNEKLDEETLRLYMEGCAPKPVIKPNPAAREPQSDLKLSDVIKQEKQKRKKSSKEKKHKKRRKSSE
ncbi:PREDICTED: RNA-binding motif protein, X-linked 2 [Drosophila arizonae]|uniref:RNA-binding motif protein, X-linked 2 n=1 Tax=Drosophila arizonae TaxID=7263 RepID=A0ABM1NTR0_DROAR|nr:PREDICTED: RNA-binding motif protein, X-linked 2 [Drosophila arizonae]